MIGINLSAYGEDLKDKDYNFEALLKEILEIEGLERVEEWVLFILIKFQTNL